MTVTWNARVTEAGTQEVAFKGIRGGDGGVQSLLGGPLTPKPLCAVCLCDDYLALCTVSRHAGEWSRAPKLRPVKSL